MPPRHPHAELVETLYRRFAGRDAAGRVACYHPEIHFTDPVFDLRGEDVAAMWAMLCERGEDLRVEYGGIEADGLRGRAHWDATYTFAATGRGVRNSVEAGFEFRDGRIVRHVDSFDFWRWSRQALGLPGAVLGWSGLLRRKVAGAAARSLRRYVARR